MCAAWWRMRARVSDGAVDWERWREVVSCELGVEELGPCRGGDVERWVSRVERGERGDEGVFGEWVSLGRVERVETCR